MDPEIHPCPDSDGRKRGLFCVFLGDACLFGPASEAACWAFERGWKAALEVGVALELEVALERFTREWKQALEQHRHECEEALELEVALKHFRCGWKQALEQKAALEQEAAAESKPPEPPF